MTRRSAALLLLLLPTGCGTSPDAADSGLPAASPGLELQDRDYAEARKDFSTKLLRSGPSPQPGEPLATPPGAEAIDYRSGDLTLRAFVTPDPGDGKKRPAVLFLHGGFAFGGDDWEMPRPFRDAGYVVMVPILRGENGQPGTFTLFYDEVGDVLAAAEALARLPHVDPTRLFIAGHSSGGTLTLLSAMAGDRFRAAASLSAGPDQVQHLAGQPELAPFDRSSIREFQMRSPVAFATSFKCPVRLYYGSEEGWARDGNRRTAMLAKKGGIDAETKVLPGDHMSSVPAGIGDAIRFFDGR